MIERRWMFDCKKFRWHCLYFLQKIHNFSLASTLGIIFGCFIVLINSLWVNTMTRRPLSSLQTTPESCLMKSCLAKFKYPSDQWEAVTVNWQCFPGTLTSSFRSVKSISLQNVMQRITYLGAVHNLVCHLKIGDF